MSTPLESQERLQTQKYAIRSDPNVHPISNLEQTLGILNTMNKGVIYKCLCIF